MSNELPRLLYVSDVPVEASYHGSMLIYRLLETYPADRLLIVENHASPSQSSRRLPDVRYATLNLGLSRLLRTRFHRWISSFLALRAENAASQLDRISKDFDPESVLTVAHGFLWTAAAKWAAEKKLPLNLIIHDDWPRISGLLPAVSTMIDQRLSRVFSQASTRWCCSPWMAEDYSIRYKAPAHVMYPYRGKDSPAHDGPPVTRRRSDGLTVVFAGTVNGAGYIRALVDLAGELQRIGGRLLIFGPLTTQNAQAIGLGGANVEIRGLLSPSSLIEVCRNEADVLFAPMSFEPSDMANMRAGFPSKLADFTAMALPILIYGPPYCSAVLWAQQNSGVAEVVTKQDANALGQSLSRLNQDAEYRESLARKAASEGKKFFSHFSAWSAFCRALTDDCELVAG